MALHMLALPMILVALLGLFVSPSSAQVVCPGTLTEVLTNIYDDMGGANWTDNNWFSTTDPCTWTGIECNHNEDVIYMDLSNMNLTGPISDYFECLPYLKSLYLNNNSLTGSIPEALCTLTNLSYLQIRSADLSGEVPECLCDLENIMFMYFSNNGLTGTIPECLSSLSFLRELHLDCNDISGTVPDGFATQPSLEELWLNCNASLTCPADFPETTILRCGDVDCDECGLVGGNCPPFVDVEGCGRYFPELIEIEAVSSERKPELC